MKALITGSERGQLFHELVRQCPEHAVLAETPDERIDITNSDALNRLVSIESPDIIINAAAYTAVDTAEDEPGVAHAVNADGVANLADAAISVDAHLLHVSTDFVFGASDGKPFREDSPVNPVSVYGQSKLAGERVLAEKMPHTSLVMRTSWVYSSHGNNFVKTMIRLMNERDEVGVVADQIGSPTWAANLAKALWRAAELRSAGTMHWSAAGAISWYDFAVAISEEGQSRGLIKKDTPINPLRSDQFPCKATRPNYSVLELTGTWERLGMQAPHWRSELREMLEEMT